MAGIFWSSAVVLVLVVVVVAAACSSINNSQVGVTRATAADCLVSVVCAPCMVVISIMAEVKMAAQCQKLVVGNSGFVTVIKDAMQLAGQQYKQFLVKTRVTKDDVKSVKKLDPKVRVDQMLSEIEAKYKSQKRG